MSNGPGDLGQPTGDRVDPHRRPARGRGANRLQAAAICAPGLEPICRQELIDLGCRPKPAGPGTINFEATPRQLYSANVWLRTASRVLVRAATFRSTDLGHLERRASELDWSQWLPAGMEPQFRVTSNDSKLYHTGAITERLRTAAGCAPEPQDPEPQKSESQGPEPQDPEPQDVEREAQLFVVRIDRNTVTISVDSSGDALHRRPWRTELGTAPLRPTMAAAMLLAAKYNLAEPLIDPFCGSGTIPIEAALIARNMPPGGERDFAFAGWSDFQPGAWASVSGEIAARATDTCPAPIRGSDRDGPIVEAAAANAARAGVDGDIIFEKKVVSHIGADEGPGLLATNPPYGKRIGRGDLSKLYRRTGAVIRDRLPAYRLAVLSADRSLTASLDRGLVSLTRFQHGGLPVELMALDRSKPDRRRGSRDRDARPASSKPSRRSANRQTSSRPPA